MYGPKDIKAHLVVMKSIIDAEFGDGVCAGEFGEQVANHPDLRFADGRAGTKKEMPQAWS